MKKQDESICRLIGKSDSATSGSCRGAASEGLTAIVSQQEGSETKVVDAHWSGQPGQDLFFNGWKLLF